MLHQPVPPCDPDDAESRKGGGKGSEGLLRASELPEWYEPYTYVQTGYRRPRPFLGTLGTVFQWHNETLCIHLHLWPGFVFLGLLLSVLQQGYFLRASAALKFLCVFGYTASAFNCLCSAFNCLCSVFTHTFQIVNARCFTTLWRLDQVSILGASAGHMCLDVFIVCVALLRRSEAFFAVVGTLLLATAVVAHRVMTVPGAGLYWSAVYLASFALTLPLSIYVFGFGQSLEATGVAVEQLRTVAMFSDLCSLSIYIAGAFFVGKATEVFLPQLRILDYFHSHAIFHVFTLIASVCAIATTPYLPAFDA